MSDDDFLPENAEEDDAAPAIVPTVDATGAESNRARKERIALEALQAKAFWQRVLRDPVGQREVYRLLEAGHVFEGSFAFACGPSGFPQDCATWFRAGQKDFAERFYLKLAEHDREAVLAMHDAFDHRFPKPKPTRKRKAD